MKKRTTIITTIIIAIMLTMGTAAASGYTYYKQLAKRQNVGRIREYWHDSMPESALENRGNDIVVVRIIGICIDGKGNGRILDDSGNGFDYISYKGVRGIRKNDIVMTVLIYAPGSSSPEDVADRFDYVIDRSGKRIRN